MQLTFGSLFSGIGGFDLAAVRAGFSPAWACEIDSQCRSVLRRRFPDVLLIDDVRRILATMERKNASRVASGLVRPEIVFGGFPCQDLSVAGQRAGLAGSRSGLWFVFRRILGVLRPRWVCIENVPGLLSSNEGRDMRVIADALGNLGYGWASRVLDAQWFGVPQRRRRVFIVGCLGDWRRAAEVLFERNSLPWDSPPRRKTRTRVAASLASGSAIGSGQSGRRREDDVNLTFGFSMSSYPLGSEVLCEPITSRHGDSGCIAHTLRAEGHDASEDGTGRGVPLVAHSLTASASATGRLDPNGETFIPVGPLQAHAREHGHAMTTQQAAESGHLIAGYVSPRALRNSDSANEVGIKSGDLHDCLQSDGPGAVAFAQNQRDEVRDLGNLAIAAEPGMKQQTFVIQERAINENPDAGPQGKGWQEGLAFTLEARHHTQAVAFQAKYFSDRDGQGGQPGPLAPTLTSANAEGSDGEISVAMTGDIKPAGTMEFMRRSAGVRRLTPRECERLQGFPDDWTRYAENGTELSDSARYRMLGNAIAVPVAEWIMNRIAACQREAVA